MIVFSLSLRPSVLANSLHCIKKNFMKRFMKENDMNLSSSFHGGKVFGLCDKDGWLALHRSYGTSDLFTSKNWSQYQRGFGQAPGNSRAEFWLGLEALNRITKAVSTRMFVFSVVCVFSKCCSLVMTMKATRVISSSSEQPIPADDSRVL